MHRRPWSRRPSTVHREGGSQVLNMVWLEMKPVLKGKAENATHALVESEIKNIWRL